MESGEFGGVERPVEKLKGVEVVAVAKAEAVKVSVRLAFVLRGG